MGSSVDFGEMFGQPTRPRRQPRFTNRLPHERPFTNRLPTEEWEMEASGSGSGTQDDKRSSVRFSLSSKGLTDEQTEGTEGSDVRHDGSAAHLNPHPNPVLNPVLNPVPNTPSTVYMVNAPSSASLQPEQALGPPPVIQRPQSAPPSPISPHTYAPTAAHAK